MQARIQKWGNSLGLRIPIRLAKQLQLHSGSPVTIEIEDGRIIIQSPKYDLDTMLKEIKSQNNIPRQMLEDGQRGNEEW